MIIINFLHFYNFWFIDPYFLVEYHNLTKLPEENVKHEEKKEHCFPRELNWIETSRFAKS